MLTICWAAKGGSGTTVTAALAALTSPEPSLLVDLAGELPWVLGTGSPDVPGILDWLPSNTPVERLDALEIPLDPTTAFIHRGTMTTTPISRWQLAAAYWTASDRRVVVDAGTNPPAALLDVYGARRVLVTRPCYLAVRAASQARLPIDAVVLVDEPGRALGRDDIEQAVNAPVIAHVLVDPAVARGVDAGLLIGRVPRGMRKHLRDVA